MIDFEAALERPFSPDAAAHEDAANTWLFLASKRVFDICMSMLLLPIMCVCALIMLALNPFFNAGPLFFVQLRMGRRCKAFRAIKFRTMTVAEKISRQADDPLEEHRITRLGRFLRKSRIDELPQILNVLRGEMSLIGPRPDYFHHARSYLRSVPGYRERHAVRPGISGIAQTEVGYVEGTDATVLKVRADLYYIQNASMRLDLWIFWRTMITVFGRKGS
ncbi:MAG: sugar transferase [Rhodobacteraceae bacterium]|nr:sugar transferase [Paracoccaceae bacterium]